MYIYLGAVTDILMCNFFYSEFGDIYDEDHFINALDGYVKVVRELPDVLMEKYDYNINNIPNIRVQAWATANFYIREVYPVLKEQGYVLSFFFFLLNFPSFLTKWFP